MQDLGRRLEDKDVWLLVNNACEVPIPQELVKRMKRDKREVLVDKQFATNVLGYHFMMSAFLSRNPNALCINVASNWAGDLDLQDVNFCKRGYDPDSAYRQSKQCDRMLTQEWAERLGKAGAEAPCVISCHPGDPCTKLSSTLGYNLQASKDCSPVVEQNILPLVRNSRSLKSGGWCERGRMTGCQFAGSGFTDERRELFEECEQFVIKDQV